MFRIPSRQLSRADLTRRAFDRAYLRLRKDTDAGVISPGEAKAKFLALRDAYYQRKAARGWVAA